MTSNSRTTPSLKGRATWCGPGDAGTTRESVADFAERMKRANINLILMEVKGGHGMVRWPSKKFPNSVEEPYKKFDMPAVLIEECHQRGIEVHAWFINYMEGGNAYVTRQHPEWVALNPQGEPTTSEMLRGHEYGAAWMCPARRPGYTDQWLIPMMVEFAEMYDVDAIHHDYVRYPGDLAPDTYCFCDYCLEDIVRFAGLRSEKYPGEAFHPAMDRPHLEANWEISPRALPGNWDAYSREDKSRFLLTGSFFPGGHPDMGYFFHAYRVDAMLRCVRETYEALQRAKPGMKVSAAVFKNAVHSGRFLGQDWRLFGPWVQYAMPMDYRAHFPEGFDTHLDLLEETIEQQKEWAKDHDHLWIGISVHQLLDDERLLAQRTRALIEKGASPEDILSAWSEMDGSLKKAQPDLYESVAKAVAGGGGKEEALAALDAFREKLSGSGWLESKLIRTMERIKSTGAEGIVLFSAGAFARNDLLDVVGDFFGR
jgi:uncharacterized lipoprotein YddW (UPF0748 family)